MKKQPFRKEDTGRHWHAFMKSIDGEIDGEMDVLLDNTIDGEMDGRMDGDINR